MTPGPVDTRTARSLLWLWGPLGVQMAVIFTASAIPNLGTLPGGISDKIAHSLGYAILGVLVLRALARGRLSGVTLSRALATVVLVTLYGISDEFHQSFVPGRTADAYDVLADCAGGASAVMLVAAAAVVRACGILKRSS